MRLFNAMKSFNQVMVSLILLTISTLSWAQKTVITYIHTDHLGTPVMATHEDGSVKWKNDYQPFGEQVKSTPTDSNVGFTGHLKDKGIGLTYMKGRWYQPESGRFMALDPIRFRDVYSFNRYVYANNNPYKYTDPDGESAVLILEGIIAADVAVPEPSDAAWPKWAGYAIGLGLAYGVDWVFSESNDEPGDWTGAEYDAETDAWYTPLSSGDPNGGDDNDDKNNKNDKKSTKDKGKNNKKDYTNQKKGHTKKTRSKRNKHERGDARRQQDKGGEKKDPKMKYRRK